MQKHTIPQYKPPAQIQELIEKRQQQQQKQNNQGRQRTAVLPKRSWIQRNPKVFQISFIVGSLLALFSKPLYDAFIADSLPAPPPGQRIPPHRR